MPGDYIQNARSDAALLQQLRGEARDQPDGEAWVQREFERIRGSKTGGFLGGKNHRRRSRKRRRTRKRKSSRRRRSSYKKSRKSRSRRRTRRRMRTRRKRR